MKPRIPGCMPTLLTALLCATGAGPVYAACKPSQKGNASDSNAPATPFTLRPALIDTSNGPGSTLGLEFEGSGTLCSKVVPLGKQTDFETAQGAVIQLDYQTSGTLTSNKNRNPKDLLDAQLNGSFLYDAASAGTVSFGGFGKYETDQSFDNKQLVYGLRATYVKLSVFTQSEDWVALRVAHGQVDPKGDQEREAALGTSDLPKYYRNDFEFVYHVNVRWSITAAITVESIELDYLYFLESSAPAQVEAAGLSRHHLATARVNFAKNLYVGYGKGRLPFDKQNDSIYEIGLHYPLQ